MNKEILNVHANPQLANEKKENQSMNEIQIWENAYEVKEYISLPLEDIWGKTIANAYSGDYLAMQSIALRIEKTEDNTKKAELKNKYDALKEKLPLLTFSTYMPKYRSAKKMMHYTGLIVLDADLKENPFLPNRIDVIKRNICDNRYTLMCFDSPKGKGRGLKIVVKTFLKDRIKTINQELKKEDLNPFKRDELIEEISDFHAFSYEEIKKYYESKFEIKLDDNAKGILGNCFLSADKDAYLNINSVSFKHSWLYSKPKRKIINNNKINPLSNKIPLSHKDILDEIFQYYNKYESGRNNLCFKISMQCKYYGISQDEVADYILMKLGSVDFTETEIRKTIRSGFKNNPYNQFLTKELYIKSINN